MQDIFPNKTLNRSVCYSNMARIDSVTVSLFFFYKWLVSGGRRTRLIGFFSYFLFSNSDILVNTQTRISLSLQCVVKEVIKMWFIVSDISRGGVKFKIVGCICRCTNDEAVMDWMHWIPWMAKDIKSARHLTYVNHFWNVNSITISIDFPATLKIYVLRF